MCRQVYLNGIKSIPGIMLLEWLRLGTLAVWGA